MQALFSLLVFVCLGIGLRSCDDPEPSPYSNAELAILASDAHVVVADTPLVLPLIALPALALKPWVRLDGEPDGQLGRDEFDAFRKAASDPRTAPVKDKLEVQVDMYGSTYRRLDFICPYFSRQWSRAICDGDSTPLRRALPRAFYLIDDRKFDALSGHHTVGDERQSDQVKAMRLKIGSSTVVCDQKASSTGTRFCTAAILIKGHLAAVWTVWDGGKETPASLAERQGKAVASFALNAIGPSENFPALLSTACELRPPNTTTNPRNDQCDMSSAAN